MVEFISGAIPLYNAERHIFDALASFAAQTYPVGEIVIVDDGSTDGSRDRVERFAAAHPHIAVRIIIQSNQGVAEARTAAVEHCRSNHVIALDADDVLHPQAVERLTEHALRHPEFALIYGDYFLIDESGAVTGMINHRQRRSDPLEGHILATQLWENVTGGVNYVRRDAVLAVGGYRMDPALYPHDSLQDVMLVFRLLLAGYPIGYIPWPIYSYRNTSGSLSKTPSRLDGNWERVMAHLFAAHPHEMAAAFVQMRQWRAEQLRDAFFRIEARDRRIAELETAHATRPGWLRRALRRFRGPQVSPDASS
jgi:glycosyltransferase involved in cell wall biosynthesis